MTKKSQNNDLKEAGNKLRECADQLDACCGEQKEGMQAGAFDPTKILAILQVLQTLVAAVQQIFQNKQPD